MPHREGSRKEPRISRGPITRVPACVHAQSAGKRTRKFERRVRHQLRKINAFDIPTCHRALHHADPRADAYALHAETRLLYMRVFYVFTRISNASLYIRIII